nr:hypothetical protein [Thiomonas sp. FB-Cd]
MQPVEDRLDGRRDARAVVLLRRGPRPLMEGSLNTPEPDCTSHCRFNEVGQGLAFFEHRLKLGSELGLDSDLGDDGRLHAGRVLRLSYGRNASNFPTGGAAGASTVDGMMDSFRAADLDPATGCNRSLANLSR